MSRTVHMLGVLALAMAITLPANASGVKEQIGKKKYDLAVDNLIAAHPQVSPLIGCSCRLHSTASLFL